MKIFVFLGAPASGKGTQSKMIGKKYNIPVISMGDLLRNEAEKKSELGVKINNIIKDGNLVPDEMAIKLLEKRLGLKDTKNGFILDGFPRNMEQVDYFKERFISKGLDVKIIYVYVSDQEIKTRISGRRMCFCGATYHLKYNPPKKEGICDLCLRKLYIRNDDKEEVVDQRLAIFHKSIDGIVEYFKKNKMLYEINGERSIKEIHEDILKRINS
jgi:adenylate kinase